MECNTNHFRRQSKRTMHNNTKDMWEFRKCKSGNSTHLLRATSAACSASMLSLVSGIGDPFAPDTPRALLHSLSVGVHPCAPAPPHAPVPIEEPPCICICIWGVHALPPPHPPVAPAPVPSRHGAVNDAWLSGRVAYRFRCTEGANDDTFLPLVGALSWSTVPACWFSSSITSERSFSTLFKRFRTSANS